MATVDQFKNIITGIPGKINTKKINEEGSDMSVTLHINRWLEGKGVTADLFQHKPIDQAPGSKYSKKYVPIKKRKGKQTVFVDLLLEGDFYAGLQAKGTTEGIEMKQTDSNSGKVKGLDLYYTEAEIYGISEDQIEDLIPAITEEAIKQIQKSINDAL